MAVTDPTTRQRPAPVGFSVGHPAITAGTIGARVVNSVGDVFILSNNHVLANGNDASIGDAILQPGPFDGGTAADQIATLSDFKPIDFSGNPTNTMDAAIARSSSSDVGNATPADDGYGTPSATIFGDLNADGLFDNVGDLLGLEVKKYGRTTGLTMGQITGINASVSICYEVLWIFCTKSAQFVDELIIEPGGFSDGGDSGSLIVSNDGGNHPVGLLFAGSQTQTIANRIDLVLNHFGVSIDAGVTPPPTPTTDVAIVSVTAPASVTLGTPTNVDVTVRNTGNQPVSGGFQVTLQDVTEAVTVGTQSAPDLAAGASATLMYPWTGTSLGMHTLSASHDLADDNTANNQGATTVMVTEEASGVHVGDLDGFSSNGGRTWSATVEVTMHDANHNPLDGVTVTGEWSRDGLNSTICTTGELGGNGSCIFLFPGLRNKRVQFSVVSVSGGVYVSAANHDDDGSSDGTTITVIKP
jgi:hypothetical protein